MNNRYALSAVFGTFVVPFVASARHITGHLGAFDDVLFTLRGGINLVIVFLFLVATVIFLWGVVRYIAAAGDEDKTAEARNMIMWGIIFLAVMVAVWGFVAIVIDFVFDTEGTDADFLIPKKEGVPQQLP